MFGLFLKVVLADNISPLVDVGFETNTQSLSVVDVFTLSFLFGYQIYFDFAAYSMIAIGCARCLGLEFPENFNFPYRSVSPKDFWEVAYLAGELDTGLLYLPLSGQAVRDRSEGGITYSPKAQRLCLERGPSWGYGMVQIDIRDLGFMSRHNGVRTSLTKPIAGVVVNVT